MAYNTMRNNSIIKCSSSWAEAMAAFSSIRAVNIFPLSESMALENHQTPHVQGGGDAAAGLVGGTAKHREKVADGEVRHGGAPIWWKKWCDEGGAAGQHGSGLLAMGEVGRLKI
jgi:hypothetical protein